MLVIKDTAHLFWTIVKREWSLADPILLSNTLTSLGLWTWKLGNGPLGQHLRESKHPRSCMQTYECERMLIFWRDVCGFHNISKGSVTPRDKKRSAQWSLLFYRWLVYGIERWRNSGSLRALLQSTDSWSLFLLLHSRTHALRWSGMGAIVKLSFAKVLKFSCTLESEGFLVGMVVPMCSRGWESLGLNNLVRRVLWRWEGGVLVPNPVSLGSYSQKSECKSLEFT